MAENEEKEKQEDLENKETPPEEEDKQEDKKEDNPPEDKEEPDKEEDKTQEKDLATIKTEEEARELLDAKGFDYNELLEEYEENGDLTKETREKLSKIGISGEVLDKFIEGQHALAETERNKLAECIGGRANYDEVLKWSGENLEQDEITSINKVTDKNILKIILKDLKNRMEEKEGKLPEYTKGEGGKGAKDIYHSQAEMFEDIKNPKYKKDEFYRATVQKKITASREAGVDLGIY